jgi:hypothetical protein
LRWLLPYWSKSTPLAAWSTPACYHLLIIVKYLDCSSWVDRHCNPLGWPCSLLIWLYLLRVVQSMSW